MDVMFPDKNYDLVEKDMRLENAWRFLVLRNLALKISEQG